MDNPIIKGNCFYCNTIQYLEEKDMRDNGKLCRNHYVCPSCNSSNSKIRLENEIKKGTAKRVV